VRDICGAGFDGACRLEPGVSNGTLDDVDLNPSAVWAGKRSQILARAARLDRRKLHRRTAGRALRTLVLFVEHGVTSVRRSELSGKPSGRVRFEGVRRNDADLNVIAFGAFEQPVFEAGWPRRNALQHHPRLAMGTAKAHNSAQELLG
jgi:hypothetical protein